MLPGHIGEDALSRFSFLLLPLPSFRRFFIFLSLLSFIVARSRDSATKRRIGAAAFHHAFFFSLSLSLSFSLSLSPNEIRPTRREYAYTPCSYRISIT